MNSQTLTAQTTLSVENIEKHINELVQLFKNAGVELNADGSLKHNVHEMKEDIKWDTCPLDTNAYNTQLLVNRGIKLPKFMNYNHYGQACISPQDLAVLVEKRKNIVEKSRTIVTACAALMHKLIPLSNSKISCANINDTKFEGMVTEGKRAICNFLKDSNTGKNKCKINTDDNCVDNI